MNSIVVILISIIIINIINCKIIDAPYKNGEPENFVTNFAPYYGGKWKKAWVKYTEQQMSIEHGELGNPKEPYWRQADSINRPTHIFPTTANPRAQYSERFKIKQNNKKNSNNNNKNILLPTKAAVIKQLNDANFALF